MEETLEEWLKNQSEDFGTEGFRFELNIVRHGETLTLNISPINANICNNKTIEISGNNIIRFE